ncbi:Rab23 [Symbiodinium natans]|uniref:Rab23 protein n=1 Tax=Symbiodinium natans TaxID=878477 RepID=A0A812U0T9_9DINO|nr:Rab23 [Symbiodinium natans]
MTASSNDVSALAQALAEIAQEDPVGAASLLGLPAAAAGSLASNTHSAITPATQTVADLITDCDDFDVDVTFNVAVVGSSCAGKSCLLQRFAQGSFNDEYRRTLVTSFIEKRHCLAGGDITFHLWDTPGGDDPRALAESCCKRSKACIVAYSAEDRQSFEAAELWVVMLRELCPGLLLALAHCKSDRPEFCDSVTLAMAKSLAAKLEIRMFSTSACGSTALDHSQSP